MRVLREDTQFRVEGQGISVAWLDTPSNRKVSVIFLRGLRDAEGKRLFTLVELAEIVGSTNRQAGSQHVEDFRECGEDFGAVLTRRRKVDAEVVEAVLGELRQDPLVSEEVLRDRVCARLGREDLLRGNIEAALDQISCRELRRVVGKQVERGEAHYREEQLLRDMLDKVESGGEVKAGLVVDRVACDRALVDPGGIRKLLTPGVALDEISSGLRGICLCMTLYFWGVSLSRLGMWMGVDKTTVLRRMMGLVGELFGGIEEQIVLGIRLGVVYVDEKWLKIRGKWYYWFVVLDAQTEIPLVCYLASTRSRWVCQWLGIWLGKFSGRVKGICHDGLKSYRYLLPWIPHLLCHFHHQQRVLTWIKEHLPHAQERASPKAQMRKLLQTSDKRTVRRRMEKLSQQAEALGIEGWVAKTQEQLDDLIRSVGSRVWPTTTNAIERFFRTFARFYKIRGGFHSVKSANEQLCLFLVVYLFTQRAKDGIAPIERVWSQAAQTPFYRLLNDPFGVRAHPQNVKKMPRMADEDVDDLLAA